MPGPPSHVARGTGYWRLSRCWTARLLGNCWARRCNTAWAESAFPTASTAYIATGLDFPDALSASAAGGAVKAPVLLVNGRDPQLDQPTAATLGKLGIGTVKVLGGPSSVANEITTALTTGGWNVTRFAGVDRVHTSYLVNKDAFPQPTSAYLATGLNFPDALAGAAAAARAGSPLLVTMPWCVSAEVRSYVKGPSVQRVTMLGGTPTLPDSLAFLPVC